MSSTPTTQQNLKILHADDGARIIVRAPNGTQLSLRVDEVSGGVKVTHADLRGPVLKVTPLGIGQLVLDAGTEDYPNA